MITGLPARFTAVVGAAVLLGGCGNLQPNDRTLPGQVAVGDDGYTVTVEFDEVANLVRNSTVQLDDVVIGTVSDIEVVDWQAHVELRLLQSVEIPSDTVFSIGQKTLLGAQYVEVAPPKAEEASAAPALAEGDVVGVDRTGTYPATEQVLGATAVLLNNGGLSQISTITSELSTALDDRSPDTRSLIRRSNEVIGELDANSSEIVGALESLDRLSEGLAEDRASLSESLDSLAPGIDTLEEERETLVRAVTETGETSVNASRVIQTSQAALLGNLDNLQPILTNLGQEADQVPEALKLGLTIPFPAMTASNALRGDYANLFATIDLRGSELANSFLGIDLLDLLGLDNAAPKSEDALVEDLSKQMDAFGGTRSGSGGESGGSDGSTSEQGGDQKPAPSQESSPRPSPQASPSSGSSGCLLGLIGDC